MCHLLCQSGVVHQGPFLLDSPRDYFVVSMLLQSNKHMFRLFLGILCEVATPSPFGEEGCGPGINLLGSHRVCDRMCVCVILKPNRCSLTVTKK